MTFKIHTKYISVGYEGYERLRAHVVCVGGGRGEGGGSGALSPCCSHPRGFATAYYQGDVLTYLWLVGGWAVNPRLKGSSH